MVRISLFVLLAWAGILRADTTNHPSFTPFQVIGERNIFGPGRSQLNNDSTKPAAPPDRLVLTGVMDYQKGQFAFFDGSRAEFQKALKEGDKVAGFVITGLEPNRAKLKSGEMQFELPVGACLLRENGGQWKAGGKVESPSPSLPVAASSAPPPTPAKASPTGGSFQPQAVSFEKWDKEERKAEKKFIKYLAGADSSDKKEKWGDKNPDKHTKRNGH